MMILLALAAGSAGAAPATLPSRFDPNRHMRVAEVRAGMKGYGLSVFAGTKIERFDVEVVSIMRNFNPKFDVVLIRCNDARMKQLGPVQGMSGSPVFLKDEQGRERMIGAFAYGWPMVKETIAGVQPIEYMLAMADEKPSNRPSPSAAQLPPDRAGEARGKLSWSVLDVMTPPPASTRTAPTGGLQPLITPLSSGGLSARWVDEFAPLFRARGFEMMQGGASGSASGGTGSGSTLSGDGADNSAAAIEPGSVLCAPLLTGDAELTAVGTCTEVIGDRVFGFGHSFNNEGSITLPMAAGEVLGVVAKLDQSFKLGASTKLRGTLTNDQLFGVAGKLGDAPRSIPIDIRVVYTDGSIDTSYHYDAAVHPKLTPLLAAVALTSSLSSVRDLPQYHTLDYSLNFQFANGKSIELNNRDVNAQPAMLFTELSLPMLAASENPFERVELRKLSGTVWITPDDARQAQVKSVNVPKLKFRPGEVVKAYVTYRPFRSGESVMPIEMELPRDLPDGNYQLVVSGWQRYLQDEVMSQPFRFSAESAGEVFDVVRDLTSIRHNALYARLMRQADGVAVGRVAMPRLPSSRRQVLLGAGRSNTTPFVSSAVKIVRTDQVMEGAADFVISIDSEAHVEVGGKAAGAKPEKAEPANTPPPTVANPAEKKSEPTPRSEKDKPEAPAPNEPK